MEPDTPGRCEIPQGLRAQMIFPPGIVGTGNGAGGLKRYDCMLISEGFSRCIEKVRLVDEVGTAPHTPVEAVFHQDLSNLHFLTFRKPPRVPTKQVVGPMAGPAKVWQYVDTLAESAILLSARGDAPSTQDAIDNLYRHRANQC